MNRPVVRLACTALLITIGPWLHADDAIDLADYPGLVRPSRQLQLSVPADGILKEILVDEGQRVEDGAVVAQMKDDEQQLSVDAAKLRADSDAQARGAKAALDEAQIMLEQGEKLLLTDATSDWEVRRLRVQRDQAQANYDSALEQAREAEVVLDIQKDRLDMLKIKSPFPSTIVRVMLEGGAAVERGEDLIFLAQLDELEAEVYLPVDAYGQLLLGAPYRLAAGKPINAELIGRLKHVDPIIDSASQTFRCVFTIDNADRTLPAGFTVTLAALDPTDE